MRDLRIERVEVVQNIAEMPEYYHGLPHLHPLIFVYFTTNRDLSVYQRVYSATFFPAVSVCRDDRPDEHQKVSVSHVFRGQEDISIDILESSGPDINGRYAYHFILYMRSRAGRSNPESPFIFIDHDYRHDGEDICFFFRGGAMLSVPHRSRDFRLPYAMIAEALARAGLPHAATP